MVSVARHIKAQIRKSLENMARPTDADRFARSFFDEAVGLEPALTGFQPPDSWKDLLAARVRDLFREREVWRGRHRELKRYRDYQDNEGHSAQDGDSPTDQANDRATK